MQAKQDVADYIVAARNNYLCDGGAVEVIK